MCVCNSAMIVVFVSVLLVVCGSDLQGACVHCSSVPCIGSCVLCIGSCVLCIGSCVPCFGSCVLKCMHWYFYDTGSLYLLTLTLSGPSLHAIQVVLHPIQ